MTKYMTGCGTAIYASKEEASKLSKSFSTGENDNYKYSVVAKDNVYIVCWKIPMKIYLKEVEPIYNEMENLLTDITTEQKNNNNNKN